MQTRRRHPLRTDTAEQIDKLGTATHRAFFHITEFNVSENVMAFMLVCVGYYVDLARAAGQPEVVYPDDVAEIFGCTAQRAGQVMRDLTKRGLLAGTAAAGYTFVERPRTTG